MKNTKKRVGNTNGRKELEEIKPEIIDTSDQLAREQLDYYKLPSEYKELNNLDLTKTYYRFDKAAFERLLFLGLDENEIALFFNMSRQTLNNSVVKTYGVDFSTVKEKYAIIRKVSIKRNLLKLSSRMPQVAIFLAKSELGMSDEVKSSDTPIISIENEMNDNDN